MVAVTASVVISFLLKTQVTLRAHTALCALPGTLWAARPSGRAAPVDACGEEGCDESECAAGAGLSRKRSTFSTPHTRLGLGPVHTPAGRPALGYYVCEWREIVSHRCCPAWPTRKPERPHDCPTFENSAFACARNCCFTSAARSSKQTRQRVAGPHRSWQVRTKASVLGLPPSLSVYLR